jgi:RNA polymerase primary sigma factor
LQIAGRHVSVDAPFSGDDDKNSLLDVLQNDQQPNPDQKLMGESLKNEVTNVLSSLSEREAEVIKLYFGINSEHSATLEEIGDRFNLTRERVRQIKEKALRNLKHAPKTKRLKSYLG